MVESFAVAFILALFSEIADKTQLVILGLALRYKSPFKVFFGALSAHVGMDGIAILIGAFLGASLDLSIVRYVVAAAFIMLGGYTFIKVYQNKSKKEGKIKTKTPFLGTFVLVLLSELGDKTQITSGLLAAKYLQPVSIFLGFVLALTIAIGLNVFIGSKIAEKLPRKTIKMTTSILFIIFGIFSDTNIIIPWPMR